MDSDCAIELRKYHENHVKQETPQQIIPRNKLFGTIDDFVEGFQRLFHLHNSESVERV